MLEPRGFTRVSGELGGPGKRSLAPGKASSGPPPRPFACRAVAVRRECGFHLAVSPGVGPPSGTPPSPVRRGLAGGGGVKI